MTLELTPEQRTDLAAAVAHKLDFIDRTLDDPRMTGPTVVTARRGLAADRQRLVTLHAYLLKSTAVILHQP
jgi:hypothetical protein